MIFRNLEEKLIANSYVDENECWIWLRRKENNGYGKISTYCAKLKKKIIKWVHRVAYETFTGDKLRKGQQVDHKCCTRLCINPNHLQKVSLKKNIKLRDKRRNQNE